jgi:hypothetical protein
MSSATLSSSPAASSTINEQLRLRITEELAGSFKGDISGPDHADYERQLRHRHPVHRPGLRLRPDDAHRGLGLRAGAGGRRAARVRPRRAHPAAQRRLARRAQARHAGLPFVPLEYVGKRLLMLVSMWLDDAEDAAGAELIGVPRNAVAGLAPWTGRGVYVNMLNFDEQDRVVEALGGAEKYAELARLKAQYDPANLFRMNANITPA